MSCQLRIDTTDQISEVQQGRIDRIVRADDLAFACVYAHLKAIFCGVSAEQVVDKQCQSRPKGVRWEGARKNAEHVPELDIIEVAASISPIILESGLKDGLEHANSLLPVA